MLPRRVQSLIEVTIATGILATEVLLEGAVGSSVSGQDGWQSLSLLSLGILAARHLALVGALLLMAQRLLRSIDRGIAESLGRGHASGSPPVDAPIA